MSESRFILLPVVDLRDFFFRSRGVGGGGGAKKINKKSSENDQLTGHFQSFFCLFFSELFFSLISPEKRQN